MSNPQELKLPLRLQRDFDRMVIKTFRELEKEYRLLARYRNHLHFTLHCKHHNVFPTSLTIKTAMKGKAANNIIQRTQRALTNLRINQIYAKLSVINEKIAELTSTLGSRVPETIMTEVEEWVQTAKKMEWDRTRMRHRKKYENLTTKSKQADDGNVPITRVDNTKRKTVKDRWVVNLSDRSLTHTEQSVLEKGLNFAVTPDTLPMVDFITTVETACRHIGPNTEDAAHLRSECVSILKQAKPPKPNLSREESEALNGLRKDKSIMVLPADKGRATVIMPRGTYSEKAGKLLDDRATYQPLKKDPTSRYSTRLVEILKKLKESGKLTTDQYRKLYPSTATVPKFYGLPKVHKKDVPLRPIVASRGSITYDTAKFVADILAPLVGKTTRHIKNSADLVDKLSKFRLEPNERLVSFDVTALFTSVPVAESITIIKDRLEKDDQLHERTTLSPEHVCDLLSCCLSTTYFTFEGNFYQQTEGAAMGSPVSPIVANLFMEDFEEKALASFHSPPRYYGRYMDDTMVVLNSNVVDDFTDHLNSQHSAIKFTREMEDNNSIAMLDTKITRLKDSLSFSVYRKPTHTDQYLQFNSHQPLEHKLGVIRTLRHRANTICSTQESLTKELQHLKEVLSISGYPKWAWETPGSKKTSPHPSTTTQTPRRGHVTIPYVQGVTEAIARKIRKNGVCVHAKPCNTIRSKLVAPKDRTEKLDQTGAIYQIECKDCQNTYVGETERKLKQRVKEHKRDSSPVGEHMSRSGHEFSQDNVSILDRESRWFQRGVKEAIYIAASKPALNRDRGRHTLPAVYKSLLQSRSLSNISGLR